MAQNLTKRENTRVPTILVAEDDGAIRTLIEAILFAKGYQIISAKDGIDALETARGFADSIDLLLSDVVMPRMNGADLACHVLAERPQTAVLLISGDIQAIEMPWQAAFLAKPFTPEALLQSVQQSLHQ